MKHFYQLTSFLVYFLISSQLYPQSLRISAEPGVTFKTNTFANGYSLNLSSHFQVHSFHFIGISIGNSFMSSDFNLPEDLKSGNFHLRDYTNITPLGEDFNLGWDLDAFKPGPLKTQTNRYFNFNIGLSYYYEIAKLNSLKIGSEMLLTYRDQMEIAKVLNVKELEFWFPSGLVKYDYNIPIYAYDTYLDIGIAPYIQYNLFKYKRLDIDVKTKVYIFPKSGEMIYNFGAVMAWKKTKEIEKSKTKPNKKRKKRK